MDGGGTGWAGRMRDGKGESQRASTPTLLFLIPKPNITVTENLLHYRHPISPYLGEQLCGKVEATYLRGQPVFVDGTFPGVPRGREYKR